MILKNKSYVIFAIVFIIITIMYFITKDDKITFDNMETHYFDRFKTVTFGTYDQDSIEENGKEPIEWYVLDERDDKALLISKDTLITIFFHESDNMDIKWEGSILRLFLNYLFYKESFTDEEREKICLTKVGNDKKNKFGRTLGNDTNDYIFILNTEELNKYFKNDNERMAKGNMHGKILGLTLYSTLPTAETPIEDATYYWVRDKGYREDDIACVNWNGKINEYGYNAVTDGMGARPCMWVKKDVINKAR